MKFVQNNSSVKSSPAQNHYNLQLCLKQ